MLESGLFAALFGDIGGLLAPVALVVVAVILVVVLGRSGLVLAGYALLAALGWRLVADVRQSGFDACTAVVERRVRETNESWERLVMKTDSETRAESSRLEAEEAEYQRRIADLEAEKDKDHAASCDDTATDSDARRLR